MRGLICVILIIERWNDKLPEMVKLEEEKMVKKNLAAAVMASALLAVPTVAFAAPAQLSVESGSTKSTETVTTTGKVSFEAGNLTLNGLTDPSNFKGGNAGTVYTAGYDDEQAAGKVTVADNLGDGGTWKLSANAAGWVPDATGSQDGADVLNKAGKLTIIDATVGLTTPKSQGAAELAPKTDAIVATGKAEDNGANNVDLGSYKLHLDKGVNMRKGTYTNTITWTLSNTPGNQN